MAPTACEVLRDVPDGEEVEVMFPKRTLLIDWETSVHGFLSWGFSVINEGLRVPVLRAKNEQGTERSFEKYFFRSDSEFTVVDANGKE